MNCSISSRVLLQATLVHVYWRRLHLDRKRSVSPNRIFKMSDANDFDALRYGTRRIWESEVRWVELIFNDVNSYVDWRMTTASARSLLRVNVIGIRCTLSVFSVVGPCIARSLPLDCRLFYSATIAIERRLIDRKHYRHSVRQRERESAET